MKKLLIGSAILAAAAACVTLWLRRIAGTEEEEALL